MIVISHPSIVIKFKTHEVQPHLHYHVSFIVHVECMNNMIKCIVIDEGTVASVMSLTGWKGLGSPPLSKFGTMLTAFVGRSFRPHGILPSLQVQLGWNSMSIEVEVVHAPLDCNLLLGHNWIYNMRVIVSSIFHCIFFPFKD